MRAASFALFLLAVLPLQAAEKTYPRADLLIEPAELAKPEIARELVILDAREQRKYDEGHTPGAHWVDSEEWRRSFRDGADQAGWAKRIGDLGITEQSRVIVYDEPTTSGARVWWVLRYWGIENVQLLNGGWTAWKAANLPVETKTPPTPMAAKPTLKPRAERLATKQLLLDSLKKGGLQIVDARSEGEFCGTQKLARKGGAIPTAKQLEWVELIDENTKRFKSPDQLLALFKEANIQLDKPTAAHCQSGGRSSVMVFALELMGAKDVRNYYASWAEWGNADDTPVEAGKPKPKP